MKKSQIVNLLVLLFSISAQAQLKVVNISTDKRFLAPRWQYETKKKYSFSSVTKSLVEIKKAQENKHYLTCISEIQKLKQQAISLMPWLVLNEVYCATEQTKKNKQYVGRLKQALDKVKPEWLIQEPTSKQLKEQVIESHLMAFETLITQDRKQAWQHYDKLFALNSLMSKAQIAEMYKLAGETAFVEQNLLASYNFIKRSVELSPNDELFSKLDSIRQNLIQSNILKKSDDNKDSVAQVYASEKERKIYQQMQSALKAGELVSAVEDGVELIKDFPGGVLAAEASDNVLQIFVNIAKKKSRNYTLLKRKIFGQMKKVGPDRIAQWSETLYWRELYEHSLELAKEVVQDLEDQKSVGELLLFAGRSATFIGDYDEAKKMLQKLVTLASGSKEGEEGLFRLGLLNYRTKSYADATVQFERLLAAFPNSDFRMRAMYWQWRSRQALGSDRSLLEAQMLVAEYPLTYYGLRARAEIAENKLNLQEQLKEPISVDIYLNTEQQLAWQRFQILLQAGWFAEAQAELEMLPKPQDPLSLVTYSYLYSQAFDHHQAAVYMQKAWEQNRDLVVNPLIKNLYPREFAEMIDPEAQKNSLESNLLYAIIKQESGFRLKATSSAGARGLMQLMPLTARGVAQRLKLGKIADIDEVYSPELNIKLGASYTRQMLRAFKDNLPMALAAYNVGIGNMRKWQAYRQEFSDIADIKSAPEDEIWIDELPWEETSFYIKAVMRNLLLYRYFDLGPYQLPSPIWNSPSFDQQALAQ